ncbi:hypothetical protein [Agrococcus sp. DT81.2]|uniref:hypothetical protein n=1 Tax=Agrococcus sp. DT81.2 TaxID=3393414 RepID=UPI003CE4844B
MSTAQIDEVASRMGLPPLIRRADPPAGFPGFAPVEAAEWTKPFVYLHSDAYDRACDCGEREWEIELARGWYWVRHRTFFTQAEALSVAARLGPDHPDISSDRRHALTPRHGL